MSAMDSIDRYRIEGELGRGGMAVVYLAEDPNLGRQVAIKVLNSTMLTDPGIRQRFVTEAGTIAKLSHPNIVEVYDFSAGDEQQAPYMVMPYLAGEDLGDRLRSSGRLDLATAMPLLTAIAKAIDHAHAAGVIHRDLKPENVMLTSDGRVILTDFGIARVLDGSNRGLTQTGMLIGTPEYMSPEQVQGLPLDYRTDLYSFGVLAWHLLCGRPPFEGDSIMGIATQHLDATPPDPTGFAPELAPGSAAALNRMLAKQPGERYQSAAQFVEALRTGSETRGYPTPPPSMPTVALPQGLPAAPAQPAPAPRTDLARLAVPLSIVLAGMLVGLGLLLAARIPEPANGATPPVEPIPPVDPDPGPPPDPEPVQPERQLLGDSGFHAGDTAIYHDRDGDALMLRSAPYRGDNTILRIPYGATVTVWEQQGDWMRVEYSGTRGWSAWRALDGSGFVYLTPYNEGYLEAMAPDTVEAVGDLTPLGSCGFVEGEPVIYRDREHEPIRLRSAPSVNAPKLASIPYGSELTVWAQDGNFCQVDYQGTTGWCAWRSPTDSSYRYLWSIE